MSSDEDCRMNRMASPQTQLWKAFLPLDDASLLRQCTMEAFRASGPGGQKRNKTSSAVRLVHKPTGCVGASSESRSQHENKATALARLRIDIARTQRVPSMLIQAPDDWTTLTKTGKLQLRVKDPRYPMLLAYLLDVLASEYFTVHRAAEKLGITSASLSGIITRDETLMSEVNRQRLKLDMKPLRDN